MSKKILPILTLLGASALIVGVSISPAEKKETFINHINTFENEVSKYASASSNITTTALKKYNLALKAENFSDDSQKPLYLEEQITNTVPTEDTVNNQNDELKIETDDNYTDEQSVTEESITNDDIDENYTNINEDVEQISTLYSLSSDIENSCDEFCDLKEDIAEAIVETQKLIQKVQQNEIKLTNEQRLFITEQAQQLKNLGRQLSSITTELSLNLSDLNQIMLTNNQDIDNLSLKYLVVLDNLVNGNEMLQSGLSSLNLINQMFNMQNGAQPNNYGRILYGFQHNNNPPVLKDYYIDENGNMIENKKDENSNGSNDNDVDNAQTVSDEKKTNIDTYKNTNLNSNLDTYNNSNLNHNIDTFFNTALLDNEFMYGNNYGYGINGPYAMNPYMNNYGRNSNATLDSAENNYNTQDNVMNGEGKKDNVEKNKDKKRFKLKKNIDTFKDENEPDIKTKLGNIKNSITGFFTKFKKSDLNDKIDNPVYRYKETER